MCFHNNSYLNDCKIKFDGFEVGRVQVAKFLGVLVDGTLSWANRINDVRKMSKIFPST